MEQIKKFLHGKGFALVLAACLLAAAAAGVWAVRTVRDELKQNLTDLTNRAAPPGRPFRSRNLTPMWGLRRKNYGWTFPIRPSRPPTA